MATIEDRAVTAAEVRSVPPVGGHGGDAVAVALALGLDPELMIDLSASMNPLAPDVSDLLVRDLVRLKGTLGRYPNPRGAERLLSNAIGVDPDLLVLTNGGAEAIALVADEVQVGNVVEPEFSLYRRHLAGIDPDAPRWRSNPSNPLGRLAAPDDRAGVWDEAFYPLATGSWTRGDADAWRLGSLTKLWNCPGLRLGYVIAPNADAANRVRFRQPEWAVNGLALDLIGDLLERTDLVGWQVALASAGVEFAAALRRLGFRVRTTDVNWVLVEHHDLRASLAPRRVVVRDCTSFGMADVSRVTVPSPECTDRVLTAFAAVAEQCR